MIVGASAIVKRFMQTAYHTSHLHAITYDAMYSSGVSSNRAGHEFRGSPFELEVKLRRDEDLVSANRAYRDLRNLRTHFAVPLVVLEERYLQYDVRSWRR
jgi:hypothetical protein